MNIFPSTCSLMQGTIQPNIKSLSIIHFFVRYFVPPIKFNNKDGDCLKIASKSKETLQGQTPRFPLFAPIKWKRRSLFKNHRQIYRNTLKTDSAFSTLCPHKVGIKDRLRVFHFMPP